MFSVFSPELPTTFFKLHFMVNIFESANTFYWIVSTNFIVFNWEDTLPGLKVGSTGEVYQA